MSRRLSLIFHGIVKNIENNYFILDTAKSFYLTDVFTIAVIFPACYPIFIVSVKLLERK